MNTLYIVRHGQDEDNANGLLNGHRNTSLTEKGKEQAQVVAKKLQANNIDVILSSPLARALQTATTIAETVNADVTPDELLIERDFGILTGKPVVDIPQYADETLETDRVTYFLKVEGAEDFSNLYERATAFLSNISDRYNDKNIAVVTHGDMGKMIRAAFYNWTWKKGLQTPYFDNTEVITLKENELSEQ